MEDLNFFTKKYCDIIPSCSTLEAVSVEGRQPGRNRVYAKLTCSKYGEYDIRVDSLKITGCKNCSREKTKKEYDEKWKKDCTKIHKGKFDYTNTVVGDVLKLSEIKCNTCQLVFLQTPASHKVGRGCPECSKIAGGLSKRNDINFVKSKAAKLGFNYDFSESVYITCKDEIKITCDKGHTFLRTPDELLNGKHGCVKCSKKSTSLQEIELRKFISKYFKCEKNNRKILKGKELDIYIPKIKVGIEYNGIYWHRDGMGRVSHFEKLCLASANGVHLISVYENDWCFRKDAVKNKLLDMLRVQRKDFTEIFFKNVDIQKINDNTIREEYNKVALYNGVPVDGFYVMKFLDNVVGIAAYNNSKIGEVIVEITRPLKSMRTNYYDNFLKIFQNSSKIFTILTSHDWLEDLHIEIIGGKLKKRFSNVPFFLYKNELHKQKKEEALYTLTKAGYSLYTI